MIELRKASKRTVRAIWTIERNLKEFQPESPSNPNMGNKDKDNNKDHSDLSEGAT